MHPKFARLVTEREFEPHLCLIWSANPSINWASPSVEAVLGYTYDTLRVRGLRSLIHPSDRRVLHNMFVNLRGPAGAAADILRVRRKDGSFLPLRIDLFSGVNASGLTYLVITGRQVKGDAEVNELRAALVRAEAALQTKDEMLATMSHELRTPLTAIIGYAELMHADDSLSERQLRSLERIREAGEGLCDLLTDLLDSSKAAAGAMRLNPRPFAVADLIERCLHLTKALPAARGLTITSRIEADVPETVVGDEKRLQQVLLNLLSNAAKATVRGEIVLAVHLCRLEHAAASLRFEVIDSGAGISEQNKTRIFERFRSFPSNASAESAGTGIGLSIAQSLVKLMKGEMGFTSQQGHGSRFWFTLTLQLATERPSAHAGADRARTKHNGRILVVDDTRLTRDIVTAILTSNGHRVESVNDGIAAIEALRCRAYDLVVMDLRMPGIGGLETMRQMRAMERSDGATPIIILTGRADEATNAECRASGATAVLTKPVDAAKLLHAINEVLAVSASSDAETPRNLSGKAIDDESLRSLVELVVDQGLSSTLDDGLRRVVESAQVLDELAVSHGADAAERQAHDLAAMAGTLGLRRISDLAIELERACAGGNRAIAIETARMLSALLPGDVASLRHRLSNLTNADRQAACAGGGPARGVSSYDVLVLQPSGRELRQ